jgi:HNH endonuclease/AP2 domain
MHRLILGLSPGDPEHVDHHDGDKLNNRRANLRIASVSQNLVNTRKRLETSSRFKGVSWHPQTQKWRAYVGVGGKLKHLGLFPTQWQAALAYNRAAKEIYGDFARPNRILVRSRRVDRPG